MHHIVMVMQKSELLAHCGPDIQHSPRHRHAALLENDTILSRAEVRNSNAYDYRRRGSRSE
jgi:hypothetical protein